MKTSIKRIKAEQILLALLEHPTREKAAIALGISASTIWRWLQKPEFQAEYRRARHAANAQAFGRMLHATPVAIATLVGISRDPKRSAATRLRAAKCLLKHTGSLPLEEVQAQYNSLQNGGRFSKNERKPRKLVLLGGDGTGSTSGKGAERTEQLIVALLQYGSCKDAANALGISPSTVWRWLQKPAFQEAYRQAKCEVLADNMVMLQKSVNGAISTVVAIMIDKNSSPEIKITAADLVMEYAAVCGREDLQAALDQMERIEHDLAA